MFNAKEKTFYHGIIPPMITPLSGQNLIDIQGLELLIEHMIGGGVQGVFILGTTGEAPSLSLHLQKELIRRTCHQIAKRVPVLVGITHTCFETSLEIAGWAAHYQADSVVFSAPYYTKYNQTDLTRYTLEIANHVPLPLFVYNIPSLTKIPFDLSTIQRLLDCPNIIGLKDSSADMIYLHQVRQLSRIRPDWSILIGPEELLAEAVFMGIDGGICGGANLFPKLYVELYQAAVARDMERIAMLQKIVLHISRTVYALESNGASYMKGLKCAMACQGICCDVPALPLLPYGPSERQQIQLWLNEINDSLGRLFQPNKQNVVTMKAKRKNHNAETIK